MRTDQHANAEYTTAEGMEALRQNVDFCATTT
jgi:hypothetical protein